MIRILARYLMAALIAAMLLAQSAGAAELKSALPMPEMVVPRTAVPPTIDGTMAPGEWDRAAAATAFTVAFQSDLARTQSTVYVTYDEQYLYVCFKNYRGPKDALLKKHARAPDDENIVFDQSNEIWITPPATPQATYQTLFNSYPGVLDCKKIPSVGYTAKAWTGQWQIAASETPDAWIVEAKAPVKRFGVDRLTDGTTWRALFTTDGLGDPGGGFRAWAPGGAFEEIQRHGFLHFKGEGPAFRFLNVESIFTGKAALEMAVAAGPAAPCRAIVTVRFGAAAEPAPEDKVVTQNVEAGPGATATLTVEADLTGLGLPTRKITVDKRTKEERTVPAGFCEVIAATADGLRLYRQVFPFVIDGQKREPPAEIRKTPYETPFGLQAFYAPLAKQLVVKVDRYYMDRRGDAATGTARVADPATGKAVAERPLAPFYHDYSEFPIDLAALKVPVQTEKDWEVVRPVEEENRKIAAQNKKLKAEGKPELPLKELPGKKPAEYTLEVALQTKDGAELARMALPVKLMGYQFEWLPNEMGISDKVIPPWTPVAWKDGELSVWNRTYRLNGLGLAERITNAGGPQLAGPMRLVAVIDGKPVEVRAGKAAAKKLTEAAADLQGAAQAGDLEFATATRAEFDGFVLNRMTVTPKKPTRLDRLTLEIAMPTAEAPCFVTTAGGWAAYHGWTPQKWDSRETSSGSRVGNFVPYIFLTDSERGFCWFADNDGGWILDPDTATQELVTEKNTVILRIHFVTRPGILEKPMTVEYGWMTTPQKPQPPGWRGYHITQNKPYPQAHGVFWMDADWAVLWPYYASPYPWDMEKSKKIIESAAARGYTGCVGAIAHAIARYRDYKGRMFTELAADWGESPGVLANGNVARGRGPNDFQVWHYDRWVKLGGLAGLYFDENYLGEDFNYLGGAAYLLPDGRIQPGYSYLGLREYNNRLRYMFHANGKTPPNLWLHTTSGQPVYAWMPDVAMEGENVEPTGPDNDYMDCLPASRLRSIGMGANLGAAPLIMCQAERHWNPAHSPFTVPQFLGWVLAHDCLAEGLPFWGVLASELGLWQDDVRFLPYWKPGLGVESPTPDVLVSAHVRPGQTVLWIINTAREDRAADVRVDLKKLGLDAAGPAARGGAPAGTGGPPVAFDAETGERYALAGGRLAVAVPKRFWRCVRLVQPRVLTGEQTFVARFDGETAAADEALGHAFPIVGGGKDLPATVPGGKTGKAADLKTAITFAARHHVMPDRGAIAFQVKGTPGASATLLTIGRTKVAFTKGKLALYSEAADPGGAAPKKFGPRGQPLAEAEFKASSDWQECRMTWTGQDVKVALGGAQVLSARLPELLAPPMARGLDIEDNRRRLRAPTITFGPATGVLLDDLVMSR